LTDDYHLKVIELSRWWADRRTALDRRNAVYGDEGLREVAHTYCHDLEPFFYVLWISARRAWNNFGFWFEGRPKQSRLIKWYTGSFDNIAEAKKGYMRADRFEYILTKFLRAFDRIEPLCKAVRGILFPFFKDGELDTGTPSNPENLYDSIIQAFDDDIVEERARGR